MAKKDFKIGDLFTETADTETKSGGQSSDMPAVASVPKKKSGRKPIGVSRTLRAFTIEDALWDDFLAYVNLCGSTQVNMINDMIREKIEQNADKIAQYKAITGGGQ